ncbi:hypothetical protein SB397_23555 [Burkholderia multivorans]|uniref:hypothetical protein n=1 Tax=Burkholderia multivorans TaxID=87883 RepID=UPI000D010381|nr:hypothetical protein [Burkholderia multivorans]MEB2488557.1 hypothetical protein [Burkholderia multivorans]MEB2570652.1 hypothetical protein [Burkholderia multivorans]PRF55557.1 hypothetical protein C6Q11_04850 [Burkholderia multivorans]
MFDLLFDGKVWSEVREGLGVMSAESLARHWVPIGAGQGQLVAKAKNGRAALLGRMGKRADGKFCIEIMARAAIRDGKLDHLEYWHIDVADAQRAYDAMQNLINKGQ